MFKEYFESNKTQILPSLAAILAFAVLAKIGGCKWLFVILALLASLAILALSVYFGYKKFSDKHQRLKKAISDINRIPQFEGAIDKAYLAIIDAVKDDCSLATSKARKERNALYNYFSGWYENNSEIRKSGDALLIDLNYKALHNYMLALSGGFNSEVVSVDEIVRDCVMKYNAHFMNKKIGVGVKRIGLSANCDPDALKFVIEQLLCDCLSRTDKGGVKLYADKSGGNALIIEDSADSSYTSEELFAVKNTGVHTVLAVCRALGVNCESASQPGRTAFRLEFPQ